MLRILVTPLFIVMIVVSCLISVSIQAHGRNAKILLPVMLEHSEITRVMAYIDDGDTINRVEASRLMPWVTAHMSEESQVIFGRIVNAHGDFLLRDTKQAGFDLVYDPREIVLRLTPDPAYLSLQSLSLQAAGFSSAHNVVPPAALSGFVNTRIGQDYVHHAPVDDGRQAVRVDLDGAVNVKGWVLEGRADYLEGHEKQWRRGDVRVVKDMPDKMIRMAAGDLSYPITGFQSYQPMAGVSIARNFSLQPYRVTEPSGQTSFVLQSPSRVEIYVNGQRVRTLQLSAGPYDISDFPVADGSNDVRLVITDATGHVEEKQFTLLSDQTLLQEGLHEYSYNVGIRSEHKDRQIDYDGGDPVLSAFHRVGISDHMTGGVSLQADKTVQQAGASVVKATALGTIGAESAVSHHDDKGTDLAARVSFSHHRVSGARHFFASAEYKGEDFAVLGQDEALNTTKWELSAGYYQTVLSDIHAGIGGRYRIGRDDYEDDWSYSVSLRKNLTAALSMNINGQHRRRDGAGVYAGLTWAPWDSRHTVTASLDTLSKTRSARWDWRDRQHWYIGAGVISDDNDVRGTGNVMYRGQRFEASVYHDVNYTQTPSFAGASGDGLTEQRTQFRAGTGLVFADGHVALSRPVENSFVLLSRHDNLSDYAIGINPRRHMRDGSDTEYDVRIDGIGPAVIPDAAPYFYRAVRVDTSALPAGYDIGTDYFISLPQYKGGSVIEVGSAANIYVDGYITRRDGMPVSLEAGIIRSVGHGGEIEQEFFTNRKGRFRIGGLMAGTYQIILHSHPHAAMSLQIPHDMSFGRYDAGTIILPQREM